MSLSGINNLLKLNLNLTDIKEDLSLCPKLLKKTSNSSKSTEINKQEEPPEINFFSISLAVGVKLNIASFRAGIKYEYSKKEKSNQIFIYYEFKFCCIKLYMYFEFKFLDFFPINVEFGFDLVCLYETEADDHNHTIYKSIPNLNAQ